MRLRFKLLLKSINSGQLASFSIASLIGAVIVLLGIWSYRETGQVTESQSNIFKGQYLVITKPVSSVGTIASLIADINPAAFSENEIRDFESVEGVNDIAPFSSSGFDVHGYAEFIGISLSTRMFLESVPDRFLDIPLQDWTAGIGDKEIPVIVPRTYLDFYNYGFAASNAVPQLSEGLVSAVSLRIRLDGNGLSSVYNCRIAGFSDRLNSILVPESFLSQANRMFGPGQPSEPVRLIVETASNGFSRVSEYISDNGYTIEGGGETARLATVLKRVLVSVIIVGAVFSILAFVLLLVTVMLMIERNRSKNAILSSLGYTRKAIATPYQLLAVCMDLVTCILATACALLLKPLISGILTQLSPGYTPGGNGLIVISAVILFMLTAALHTLTIRRNASV